MHRHYLSTVGKLSNKLSVEGIYKISKFIAELSKYSDNGFDGMQILYAGQHSKVCVFLVHVTLTQIFGSFYLRPVKMDLKLNSLYFQQCV